MYFLCKIVIVLLNALEKLKIQLENSIQLMTNTINPHYCCERLSTMHRYLLSLSIFQILFTSTCGKCFFDIYIPYCHAIFPNYLSCSIFS